MSGLMKVINSNAFTLFEVIISLLLISLVVMLTYSSIDIVEKQFGKWQREQMESMETSRFLQVFGEDLYRSTDYRLDTNRIEVTDYVGNSYNYHFKKSQVVREIRKVSDTFNISAVIYLKEEKENTYLKISTLKSRDSIRVLFQLPVNHNRLINKMIFNED